MMELKKAVAAAFENGGEVFLQHSVVVRLLIANEMHPLESSLMVSRDKRIIGYETLGKPLVNLGVQGVRDKICEHLKAGLDPLDASDLDVRDHEEIYDVTGKFHGILVSIGAAPASMDRWQRNTATGK